MSCEIIDINRFRKPKKPKGKCEVDNLNHSQIEKRCECCCKPVSQLQPFSKDDDPQFARFDGAFLVSVPRRAIKPDYQIETLWNDHFGYLSGDEFEAAKKLFIKLYGENAYEEIEAYLEESCCNIVLESICSDCIYLDDDEYYEKREISNIEYSKNRISQPNDAVIRLEADIHNDFYEEVPAGKTLKEEYSLD